MYMRENVGDDVRERPRHRLNACNVSDRSQLNRLVMPGWKLFNDSRQFDCQLSCNHEPRQCRILACPSGVYVSLENRERERVNRKKILALKDV